MTKIKREYIARRRRTKIRLFASTFRGAHLNQINVMHNEFEY